MKKTLSAAFAAGLLLSLTACSADNDLNAPNDGTLSFTVRLPEQLATRTPFGDAGTINANQLSYTVFDADGKYVMSKQRAAFGANVLSEQESIKLVSNQEYTIVFYANNTGGFSSYDLNTAAVTVNYTNAHINSELDDAFYAAAKVTADGGNHVVTLYRPFAQINVGTDDLKSPSVAALIQNVRAKLTLTGGIYSSFNCLDGTVSAESTDALSFSTTEAPVPDNEQFPITGYDDLMTCYVLVPSAREISDATFEITNGSTAINTLNLTNLPLQGNYRTNIYGTLLTTKNNFNITIDPAFEEPSYNVGPWVGDTLQPVLDKENKTADITSPAELAWLAEQLASTDSEYADYTFNLTKDLDLNNQEWTPVGSKTDFTGTFNGNNHTISNLTITKSTSTSNGLFGRVTNGGTVSDVNLENVNISLYSSAGAAAGYVEGGTINNVNVTSGTVKGSSFGFGHMVNLTGVGGVVGTVRNSGTVSNCTNEAKVNGGNRFTGGIVGAANGTAADADIVIENCTNKGDVSASSSGGYVGGICGDSNAKVSNCTNDGNVTGANEAVGGICGEQKVYGSVTGCVNNGNVTNNSDKYGCGGIVGFARYYYGTDSAYKQTSLLDISGNTNYGNITGGCGCGGIVGVFFNYGTCDSNKNFAKTIAAKTTFAAGIIGNQQYLANLGEGYVIPNVPADAVLTIKGNLSTTPLADITAPNGCTAQFVYVNNAAKVDMADNTDTETPQP